MTPKSGVLGMFSCLGFGGPCTMLYSPSQRRVRCTAAADACARISLGHWSIDSSGFTGPYKSGFRT